MKKFSIIIPAYNEQERISDLLNSIKDLNYPKDLYEVIVVNDGSTDNTRKIVKTFNFVKTINLSENKGRFYARKIGSEKAKYENILFVDARSILDTNALKVLNKNEKYRSMIGHSLGVDNPNAFETFYSLIRKIIFGKIGKNIIEINKENFDKHPKGTGILFVKKDLWTEAVKNINDQGKNISDDTKILRYIAEKGVIAINPDLKIINFARTSFLASLNHLFNRGIKFIDYYFDIKKSRFWTVILLPQILFLICLTLSLLIDYSFLIKIGLLFSFYFLTIAILTRNLKEFLKIFLISPLILVTFYLGINSGIILKLRKSLNNKYDYKKIISTILTIIVISVFVVYFYKNHSVLSSLNNIAFKDVLFIFLLQITITIVYGILNHIIIRKIQKGVSLIDNIFLQFSNNFLNKVFPKGGTAFRSIYLKEVHKFPYSKFISTVSGMYVISFLSYSIIAFLVFLVFYIKKDVYNIPFLFSFFCLFLLSLVFIFLPTNFFSKKEGRFFRIINSILNGWSIIKKDLIFVSVLVFVVITVLLLTTLQVQIIYNSLGMEIEYLSALFLSVISILTIFLQLTPDGIGVKEGFYIYSAKIISVPADLLVLGSLVDRAIAIIISIFFGGISYFYLLDKYNKDKLKK